MFGAGCNSRLYHTTLKKMFNVAIKTDVAITDNYGTKADDKAQISLKHFRVAS